MASYTSATRLTGLSSGVDTDSYVEQLMSAASTKYYEYQRKVQKLQWKQEAYRSTISSISDFQSKWLDITSSTSVRMQKTFNKYKSSATTLDGVETSSVSISSIKGNGNHTIEVINKAESAKLQADSNVSVGGKIEDLSKEATLNFKYDGVSADITLSAGLDAEQAQKSIQEQLDAKYGEGKVTASVGDDGTFEIRAARAGHTMTISAGDESDGNVTIDQKTNKISSSTKLANLIGSSAFDDSGVASFTVNGQEITLKSDMTVSEMISAVNNSSAGVTMAYNSVAGTFTIESSETGAVNKVDIADDNGVMKALGFTNLSATGKDALLKVDGVEVESTSNKIQFEEFTADISNASDGQTVKVSTSKDTDAIYNLINDFVNDYNTLIAGINSTATEERSEGVNGYYEPLTDDEKKEMDDDDIEKWEKEAKKGILNRDSLLTGFLSSTRATFYSTSAVAQNSKGQKVGIYNLGITTGDDYTQGGKLYIDEDTLKDAIENDSDALVSLLNTIGDSLNKVANNYIGTNGSMTLKAGIVGKASENDNYLRTEINDIKDKMEQELERLQDKEERYYEMFSNMETLVNSNNTMLDTLTSYFG
jgi:flagellar hook-associated protein 2